MIIVAELQATPFAPTSERIQSVFAILELRLLMGIWPHIKARMCIKNGVNK